jgi:hypothetical protein
MSATYPFTVEGIENVNEKIEMLNSRLLIDVDLSELYSDIKYQDKEMIIEINFRDFLSEYQQNILTNVVNIIIYNAIPSIEVYILNQNNLKRNSTGVKTPSDFSQCDYNLGYVIGSLIITDSEEVYICTNNQIGRASWKRLG